MPIRRLSNRCRSGDRPRVGADYGRSTRPSRCRAPESGRCGPGRLFLEIEWLWPCSTSSAPSRARISASARWSPRLRMPPPPSTGGWCSSTTRIRRASRAGALQPPDLWRSPSLPAATKGRVGTPLHRPMIATPSRRRRIGKSWRAVVAAHPGAEFARHQLEAGAQIGVVIARREADFASARPEVPSHCAASGNSAWQADIADVAGHGDMVGAMRAHVGDQRGQRVHVMGAAAAAAAS